ncbi:MAG TPA: outer membrane protein assembly factor BamD [Prosthecobacter sp.]|nr:outer membrane protein assembly factor BamD [Prosthecobacter sp.]
MRQKPGLWISGGRVLTLLPVICLALLTGPFAALAEAPADPEVQGLYARAQKALANGDSETALQRFQTLAHRHPGTELAALAVWEISRIQEHSGDHEAAFASLNTLIIRYPQHFEKAHNEQFRVVRRLLDTGKENRRTLEPVRPSQKVDPDVIATMLQTVIRHGPHSAAGIQAHYYLAIAKEKAGLKQEAIGHYEDFVEAYPEHELVDDASYQMAYIPYKEWKASQSSGPRHRESAAIALSYFVARFPESDKVAQAQSCLSEIRSAELRELRSLARYYASRGNTKAAAVYYEQLAMKFPQVVIQDSVLRTEITGAGADVESDHGNAPAKTK